MQIYMTQTNGSPEFPGRFNVMKDAGLRIRVKRDLREKFLELCRRKDRPAVQVVREFMRRYIAEHDPENDLHTSENRIAKTD